MLPAERNAVASEFAGIVTGAQIDVPVISLEIVKAMRVDHAGGERRKIVVEGFNGFLGEGMSRAKEIAD